MKFVLDNVYHGINKVEDIKFEDRIIKQLDIGLSWTFDIVYVIRRIDIFLDLPLYVRNLHLCVYNSSFNVRQNVTCNLRILFADVYFSLRFHCHKRVFNIVPTPKTDKLKLLSGQIRRTQDINDKIYVSYVNSFWMIYISYFVFEISWEGKECHSFGRIH